MDVFISYRRRVGISENSSAALIKNELEKRGVECFFDINSIHSENFWEKIKEGIDRCPNFLMIYTKGYFGDSLSDKDFVQKEILYAREKNKRLIAISFEGYDPAESHWLAQTREFGWVPEFNVKPYRAEYSESSIQSILDNMVDHSGRKFSLKKRVTNNSWYNSHEMTDEDRVWIITDHAVCRELDWKLLEQAINTRGLFDDRKELSVFAYKAYDIKTYASKYGLRPRKPGEKQPDHVIKNVYGVTYESLLEEADDIFGKGHFIADTFPSENYTDKIYELLEANGIEYFDIIDLTLVIKDVENPQALVCKLAKFLNPDGGIIYIRELDDDYIDAYPDKDGRIKRLCRYLELDDGAGNRHTGKKIYNFLNRAGADKTFISNEIISTANQSAPYRQAVCMTYFSYLIPEFKALCEPTEENRKKPNYEKYKEAYDWLLLNYDEIENDFRSPEFYFRAGYVAGYGIFAIDDDNELFCLNLLK